MAASFDRSAFDTRLLSPALNEALALILHDEGGYAERAMEGGGAVNMGITFTVFVAWRLVQGKPHPSFADLKAMPLDEAKAIYAAEFAAPLQFERMPIGTGYVILDSAVNNGKAGCQKHIEMAVGQPVDGKFDAVSFWAASHRPPLQFVNAFCAARAQRQKTFRDYGVRINPAKPRTWGDAWDERNEKVRKRALAMIAGVAA